MVTTARQIACGSVIASPLVQQTPKFDYIFNILWQCLQQRRDKFECCRCTTTKLPLSNDIKIVSEVKHLNGDLAFINSTARKAQWTKKQKTSNFFAPPHSQQSISATNLATVIEELHKISAPRKRFGMLIAIVPLWLFLIGENAPNFKPP